ncbi:hypothetical protein DPEC_G00276640 [Dallia pectoralis]|uniref:Uncharacterized protein n=1 Tax=Dallia pectoralis TaxID=75939 RepID=A0ACC2FLM1_DALPE|nr:hypothetical protein DPEC_G00276640 [Dallia pectoralis]
MKTFSHSRFSHTQEPLEGILSKSLSSNSQRTEFISKQTTPRSSGPKRFRNIPLLDTPTSIIRPWCSGLLRQAAALRGHEDQGNLLVPGAQQGEHPLGKSRHAEAVHLGAGLGVVEGHLALLTVQVDAHPLEAHCGLQLSEGR